MAIRGVAKLPREMHTGGPVPATCGSIAAVAIVLGEYVALSVFRR